MKNITFILLGLFITGNIHAQCENWNGATNKDQLEEFHVLYQQEFEAGRYEQAYEYWSKVFPVAPAADGKRISQYLEGAKIHGELFKSETDKAKKQELKEAGLAIFDQLIECYKSGGLPTEDEADKNKKIGFVYGRKAFDMFYTFNELYSKTLEAIDQAIEYAGNDNEYVIFAPAASIVAYNVKKGKMDKKRAVQLYNVLNEIADYNINKGDYLSEYFAQARDNMNGTFATVEDEIFDCDYFKAKLKPGYEDDPENYDLIKYTIVTLKQKGCAVDDPFLVELEELWAEYAAEYNAQQLAEFQANNPAVVAKELYDKGDYKGAIEKYDEAIEQEEDSEKKASYLFSKASIQFRKLKQYSTARATAREAAVMRPGWGRPYMLIGDMYGASARNCGDSWNQRLAILAAIDKYQEAKIVDPSAAEEANARIAKYNKSKPKLEDGFQRGIKEGDKAKVGCWIGETVRISFSK